MVYVVENGVPTLIEELHSAASGEITPISEAYVVADGTPALVYSSGFAVTIQGAPGETVSYTGKDSGSVTLNANGDAELELRPGVYTFVGSISGTRSNIRIARGVPVTMWPDGYRILYWYGRFGLLDDGVTKQSIEAKISTPNYANGFVEENTNTIRLGSSARYYSGEHANSACIHFQPVSFTGYTQLSYRVSGRTTSGPNATRRTRLGQKSEVSTSEPGNSFTANGTYTYAIDPDQDYVCASTYAKSNGDASWSGVEFCVDAVYLT